MDYTVCVACTKPHPINEQCPGCTLVDKARNLGLGGEDFYSKSDIEHQNQMIAVLESFDFRSAEMRAAACLYHRRGLGGYKGIERALNTRVADLMYAVAGYEDRKTVENSVYWDCDLMPDNRVRAGGNEAVALVLAGYIVAGNNGAKLTTGGYHQLQESMMETDQSRKIQEMWKCLERTTFGDGV